MKHLLLLLLLVSSQVFSQNSGITYQAVIYNPNGEELPGVDNPYAPLVDQDICLQFGIIDANGNVEYQEETQVTTDAFGMVNLLVGTNSQTAGFASGFTGIEWSSDAKFLKVDIDIKGSCLDFEELSNQPFTYVPFAYYSPASDIAGPQGDTGPQGLPGLDGAIGPQGDAGSQGTQGAQGDQGPIGLTGDTGPQGAQGDQGPIGLTGPAGEDGVAGPQGQTGATGVAGPTGPQGSQGTPGINGENGQDGFLLSGSSIGNTPFWNDTEWVITSNNLFNDGTNVGIGTSSPTEKLHLNGNMQISGNIQAQDSGQNITIIPGSSGVVDVSNSKIVNLANATEKNDAVNAELIQFNSLLYAPSTGIDNSYEILLTPAPTAYQAGMMITFKANFSNTAGATLDLNGLGPKSIKKKISDDLSANDINTGQMVIVIYDGTNFQMTNYVSNNTTNNTTNNLIYTINGF